MRQVNRATIWSSAHSFEPVPDPPTPDRSPLTPPLLARPPLRRALSLARFASDGAGTPPPRPDTPPSSESRAVARPVPATRWWCAFASHASRTTWNATLNVARPSAPNKKPPRAEGEGEGEARPSAASPSSSSRCAFAPNNELSSAVSAKTSMGMKSFHPRLVWFPPLASDANRPCESLCVDRFASSSFTALTLKSIHAFRSCVITPGSASPAVLLAAFGEALEATAPGTPVAPPRAPSRPASGSLLSTHTLRRSESRTRLWYTLRRKLQSPAGKLGDMIFCVLIISLNALKLSTVHVNTPLIGGDADANRASSTDASVLCRRWSLGRSSRRNAHDSLSTATSARIVKAPSSPLVHARSAARSAKSHQPWDLRREEKRCQLSRATRRDLLCVGAPSPSPRDVSGLGRALSSYATKHSQFPLRGFASAGAVTSRYAETYPGRAWESPRGYSRSLTSYPPTRTDSVHTWRRFAEAASAPALAEAKSAIVHTHVAACAERGCAPSASSGGLAVASRSVAASEDGAREGSAGRSGAEPETPPGVDMASAAREPGATREPATARGRDVAREAERGHAERSRPARERQCAAGAGARAPRARGGGIVRSCFSHAGGSFSSRRAPPGSPDVVAPDSFPSRLPALPPGLPRHSPPRPATRRSRSARAPRWAGAGSRRRARARGPRRRTEPCSTRTLVSEGTNGLRYRAASVARARSPPCVPACRR